MKHVKKGWSSAISPGAFATCVGSQHACAQPAHKTLLCHFGLTQNRHKLEKKCFLNDLTFPPFSGQGVIWNQSQNMVLKQSINYANITMSEYTSLKTTSGRASNKTTAELLYVPTHNSALRAGWTANTTAFLPKAQGAGSDSPVHEPSCRQASYQLARSQFLLLFLPGPIVSWPLTAQALYPTSQSKDSRYASKEAASGSLVLFKTAPGRPPKGQDWVLSCIQLQQGKTTAPVAFPGPRAKPQG